ncbi:PREDICTED: DDB1- and CUL4-associated factor 8-like [Priapulus caudatus]|uniref:DDB1- and CUL4-associated factor 8-like n=1 Tax=Priapulus caudatus TaxID=37621 RepID=A0ABM1DSC2_PRICU|nr:PREDICTED: DDB1- and CUL4-associated factor 8-like [Priapulus caudatus]
MADDAAEEKTCADNDQCMEEGGATVTARTEPMDVDGRVAPAAVRGVGGAETEEEVEGESGKEGEEANESIMQPLTEESENNRATLDDAVAMPTNCEKLRKDDSGICVVDKSVRDGAGSDDDAAAGKTSENPGETGGDEDEREASVMMSVEPALGQKDEAAVGSPERDTELRHDDSQSSISSRDHTDDNSEDDDDDEERELAIAAGSSSDEDVAVNLEAGGAPKHRWFAYRELTQREYGFGHRYSPQLWGHRYGGSLHVVQRFELMYKLDNHRGCVNTVHFNSSGNWLASGSDDLNIIIWDWASNRPVVTYDSGHRNNVFQAKFLPFRNDTHIVSCARDGVVRIAELSSSGDCRTTRRLASHRGAAHKLSLEPDSPHVFLSAGEDGVIFEIDVRQNEKPNRLLTCKENNKKVALYTIHSNPGKPYEFATGGRDQYARIYDKRKITSDSSVLNKYCPHHLLGAETRANITCLVYNYNGSELLVSYNDEDIYTFDTSHSTDAEHQHRYQGHRNSATVKGVNYYGPCSEFIVSGSDCGHVFLWDHDTERIVSFLRADEGGVVNCLEPHPLYPVLATSGLDNDIKVWVPSLEEANPMSELKLTVERNLKRRKRDHRLEGSSDFIDGQMLWFLMRQLRRRARRQAGVEEEREVQESSSSDTVDSDDSEESDMPAAVQCAPS